MNSILLTLLKCATLWLLLCVCTCANAQKRTLYGEVLNEASTEKIEGATVVLKSGTSSVAKILAYDITSTNGTFCLKTEPLLPDSAYMEVKCIGFKPHKQRVINNKVHYEIQLKEEAFSLKEVTVKAQKIKQSGDTISYNIASFATTQDRSIGDVLSNMPGVSVADNGQISYNGNRISHLYIEGNDLFNEKYGMATQNLSYKDIARAEIIENHQPIKALASSNDDSKRETALNLKLKEGAKSKWGGYIQAAGGIRPNTWEGELFAANFSAFFQSASTVKSNNSGKPITKENEALTLSDILNMQNYKDSRLSNFIQTAPTNKSDLNEDRTKTGPSHILNNSNLWKINEHTSLHSQITYSDDHTGYRSNSQTNYFLTDSILSMGTSEQYNSTFRNLQGDLCIKSNQESYYLSNKLHTSASWTNAISNIQHNSRRIFQEVGNQQFSFSNEFEFMRRYGKHLLQVNSYNSYIHLPEKLIVKDEYSTQQTAHRKHVFSHTQVSHSLDWNRWNFTTKANFQAVSNHLESELEGLSADTAFSNAGRIGHLHFKLIPQIAYKSRTLTYSFQVPLSYYRYKKAHMGKEHHFFYMPDLFLKWKISPFFTLFVNGSAGMLSSGYDFAYVHPIMSNYKTISSGFLSFQGKKRAQGTFRFSYANPIEMLFAHVSVSKSTDTSDKQIEKSISHSTIFYNYRPGNSRNDMVLTDFSLQKGIDCMNGKIELHAMYQSHKSKLVQNGIEEPYKYGLLSTDLTIKSTIASCVHIEYKARYSNHRLKSDLYQTDNKRIVQHLSCSYSPTKSFSIKASGEHYYNYYSSNTKQKIILLDIYFSYQHKNNEWFCSGRNIFNEHRYAFTEYNDLSSQTILYDIRPRTIMIGFRRLF